MNGLTPDEFRMWLDAFELHVESDLTCDCPQPWIREHSEHCRPYQISAISTASDPTVGIFGYILTPWCKTEDELVGYVSQHRADIEVRI
jgi:hypothetical protein